MTKIYVCEPFFKQGPQFEAPSKIYLPIRYPVGRIQNMLTSSPLKIVTQSISNPGSCGKKQELDGRLAEN